MRIFVITPPSGPRNGDLFDQLDSLSSWKHVRFDAIMLDSFPEGFDHRRARAMMNRDLLPAEVGCAASHRELWATIATDEAAWACVLEDDAVLFDADAFDDFLHAVEALDPGPTGTLVSFFSFGAVAGGRFEGDFLTLISEPSGAVAYCISREAARRLATANSDGAFIADWPRGSGVRFLLTNRCVIQHGTESTHSLIGRRRRTPSTSKELSWSNVSPETLWNRFQLYSFVGYLRNRRYFDGPSDYYRKVLRHRIIHHLGRVVGRRDPDLPQGARRLGVLARSSPSR